MAGAWCFLDHIGPIEDAAGHGLHVGPHPHIGPRTFTWMIEGEITHRGSPGYTQAIRPGQVNLMTAGDGIAHSEDTESRARGRLQAVQLWIALPEAQRHRTPAFQHYADLPLVPHFEHAVLVLSGEVCVESETLSPGTLVYLGSGRRQLQPRCREAGRLILIGGEPFGERILLWRNFVARRPEEIEQAGRAWNQRRHFDEVQGSPSARLGAQRVPTLHVHDDRHR